MQRLLESCKEMEGRKEGMCREGTGFLVPEREAHENEKIPSHVRKRVLIRAAFPITEGVWEQGVQENKSTKEEDAESHKTKSFTTCTRQAC
jgi:hypothetical protein